jgi:SPOR domain
MSQFSSDEGYAGGRLRRGFRSRRRRRSALFGLGAATLAALAVLWPSSSPPPPVAADFAPPLLPGAAPGELALGSRFEDAAPLEISLAAPDEPTPPPEAADAAPAPAAESAPPVAALAPPEAAPMMTAPPEPAAPEAVPLPRPAPPRPAASEGRVRIQLASVKSATAARRLWSRLQQQEPDILGPLRPRVERAALERGTVYRVQAGPLVDRKAAQRICAALERRKLDCMVVG